MASRKRALARKSIIGLPDVLRALPADDTRSLTLSQYRAAGFTPDHFTQTAARKKMADSLTRAEDWLELEHIVRWRRERPAIQAVRRELEYELWP
jgi:hypothetical protein